MTVDEEMGVATLAGRSIGPDRRFDATAQNIANQETIGHL